jgi:CheY-like chemotaxis protein
MREHQELGVPADVADGFEAFVREWVAAAESDETFHWSGVVDRPRVRRLSAYWLMLVTHAREHPGQFGIEPAPPEAEEFFVALATAMAIAIGDDDDRDDFVELFEETVPAFDARPTPPPPSLGEPVKVLIVDDTDDVRLLLRVALRNDPRFEVTGEAANGQEAIDLVAEECPDAVLLDVMMPVMDGLTALPLLLERCPDLHVVVVSAASEEVHQRALGLGAARVLSKTTPVEAIKEAVAAAR